ncbi:MAG: class I SAM-dependent methyltransferase [bacterium]|nr:class I SAM-dependent methyltransferase [bacterium]
MSFTDYYDAQADATGWLGPEIVFGLAYRHIRSGDTLLDIGIGTGLGSIPFHKAGLRILGMDLSEEMLEGTKSKGIAAELKLHDLTSVPYPYGDESLDHAICVGVLQFFRSPNLVFGEAARMLRDGGVFAFTTADRDSADPVELTVGPEHTGSDESVTMYLHEAEAIRRLLLDCSFTVQRELEFTTYMDEDRRRRLRARAYLAQRSPRI